MASSTDAQLASDAADKSLEKPTETSKAADALANGKEQDADEHDEVEDEDDAVAEGGVEGSSGAAKKKKKKSKKNSSAASTEASAALAAAAQSSNVATTTAADIPALLKQLALDQRMSSSAREGKDPSEYKFWNTQPVPKFKEPNLLQTTDDESAKEGPILPSQICKASAKAEPEKLLEGFDWCLVDLSDAEETQELYDLLENHYVEDLDGKFRFKYSTNFLEWALKPPGWKKEWHIGVRTASKEGKKGKLVAFIAGVPVTLKVRDEKFNSVEINFLTIHRKLRSKRLAPVLIKEITRRCYRMDIYQALYTAGTLLPTPVSTCRYYHRSLDWEHLYKNGFSHLPPGATELRMKHKYRVEANTSVNGFRPMRKEDVPAVLDLLVRYLDRFSLRQEWTPEEIEHWLCSAASKGVVWAYVVEHEGKITDFISYYLLESTVLKSNNRQESIRAAYLYYYASESAFESSSSKSAKQSQQALATRLQALVQDLLVLAKKEGFHVFNALSLLDGPLFLAEQKFERGDGRLNYYLFNWRTKLLPGGVDANFELDTEKMGGVGVVML